MASWADVAASGRGNPEVFTTTPHYDGYPAVLVRLAAVPPPLLCELREDAWRLAAPKRLLRAPR